MDCWPLFNFVSPHCVTVNFSIGVFTHVRLEPRGSSQLEIILADLGRVFKFSVLDELIRSEDSELKIIRGVAEFFKPQGGFRLEIQSESPIGGGLGGSSSLTVSLLKAFAQWQGRTLTTLELVEIAHNLESKVIHAPTGTQDYFPAIEKGLHFIHYTAEGPRSEVLPIPSEVFSQYITLVYTGVPHHSGINNWQVIKRVIEGDVEVLSALRKIAFVSHSMMEAIRQKDWGSLPGLFNEEFYWRLALTPSFSSPRIEELKSLVQSAGAEAIKICGAGGGGCVALWSHPDRKQEVESACRSQKANYQILPLNLDRV